MSELHQLQATTSTLKIENIEAVDPKFAKEGLVLARAKTIEVLEALRSQLKEGMTEDEARKLALAIFSDHGVTKHWHKPYIRFGAGTALTFHDPLQPDYHLQPGDPYYLDLGPVWPDAERGLDYEGDYGDTFVFGTNPEAEVCAQTARRLFAEAQQLWRQQRLHGPAIYAFLKKAAQDAGYRLVEGVEGHRLGDFPHHKYSKERLAQVPFAPAEALWVLEVQINHPTSKFGAFFEDIL